MNAPAFGLDRAAYFNVSAKVRRVCGSACGASNVVRLLPDAQDAAVLADIEQS